MMIPDDARRDIEAMKEGLTQAQFINAMWKRREAERKANGLPARKRSAKKAWPYVMLEHASNVTPIKRKAKA